MAVNGTVNVNASFIETLSETSCETERKLSLASANVPASSKVAIVSGTCGTSAATLTFLSPGYTDPNGDAVEFSGINTVDGVAFVADSKATLACVNASAPTPLAEAGHTFKLSSQDSIVAMTSVPKRSGGLLGELTMNIFCQSGTVATANYSLLMWGT